MPELAHSDLHVADLEKRLAAIGFPDVSAATLERCLTEMGQDLQQLVDRAAQLASGAAFDAARRDVRRVLVCASPLVSRVIEALKLHVPLSSLVAASQRDAELLKKIKDIDGGDGSHADRVIAILTSCREDLARRAWEARGGSARLAVFVQAGSIGWTVTPVGMSGLADFSRDVVVQMPPMSAAHLVGVLTGLAQRVRFAGRRHSIELRAQGVNFLIAIDERRTAIARLIINHAEAARLALLLAWCSSDL